MFFFQVVKCFESLKVLHIFPVVVVVVFNLCALNVSYLYMDPSCIVVALFLFM